MLHYSILHTPIYNARSGTGTALGGHTVYCYLKTVYVTIICVRVCAYVCENMSEKYY